MAKSFFFGEERGEHMFKGEEMTKLVCLILQMLKHESFPGSLNGTGLFQTLVGFKVREVYERLTKKEVVTTAA